MTTTLRLSTLALLASSTLVLTQCKKKAEEPAAPKISEREKFLTAANWVTDNVTQEQITAAGIVTTTAINVSSFDPCNVDDSYHYRADRTFLLDDGPLTCIQLAPNSGTWEFASNETELVVKRGSYTNRYPIQRLTATALSYVITRDTRPDGTQVSLIQNLVAQ
jgi:hypothetical protein